MIKVLLVEDQNLFREGVHALLANEADMKVVGVAEHGQAAIRQIEKTQPDIVLMDVHMPEVDGIKATIHIKENCPHVNVILLTTFADEDMIMKGLTAGAKGFLLKTLDASRLIRSIRDVYEDQIVLSGEAARILVKKLMEYKYDKKEILSGKLKSRAIELSSRELDVAFCLMENRSNKWIAQELYLSEGTIKNYISELYDKLAIHSRKDAIAFLLGL